MAKELEQNHNPLPEVSFAEFTLPDYEQWKNEAVAALKGAPFEKKLFTKTYEGIALEPIYTQAHTQNLQQPHTFPGGPDYLRSVKAEGYLKEPWAAAQAADSAVPAESNAILKYELAKGATAVNIVLADSVRQGQDFNAAAYERGVIVATLADIEALLQDIDLTKYPIQIAAGASALPVLALLQAHAKQENLAQYTGCVGADPLGALAEYGTLPAALPALYDEMAQCINWAKEQMPQMRTVLVQGQVYDNGGANSVQEVAYCPLLAPP